MNNEIKLKLLDEIEVQAVGILLENEIVKYIKPPKNQTNKKVSNTFANITVVDSYLEKFNISVINDDKFEEFVKSYPVTHRGTRSTVKNKLQRFLMEYPMYSIDLIYECIQAYIREIEYTGNKTYMFNLNNMFYKQEGSFTKSPILDIIAKYKKNEEEDIIDNIDIDI